VRRLVADRSRREAPEHGQRALADPPRLLGEARLDAGRHHEPGPAGRPLRRDDRVAQQPDALDLGLDDVAGM
jgi:hypothetical protein